VLSDLVCAECDRVSTDGVDRLPIGGCRDGARSCQRRRDLSRYMGASMKMIDLGYGHLACDGRGHAIKLLDTLNASWTLRGRRNSQPASVLKTKAIKQGGS
jgi:hypothetical protein